MTRERENVSDQLVQAEQVKLVAEGELADVRQTRIRCLIMSSLECELELKH